MAETQTTALGSDTTPKADDPATTPAPTSEVVAEPQQPPAEVVEPPKAGEPVTDDIPKPKDAPGAPSEYEFKPPPEGQTPFEESVMDAFKTSVRELNLTNDGAQSILDGVLPAMEEAAKEKLDGMRAEWKELSRTDKEFGGDAFKTSCQIANTALDRFCSAEMQSLLIESGFADHPEFVRAFVRIGKAISEDTILAGRDPIAAEEDLSDPKVQERRMYKT